LTYGAIQTVHVTIWNLIDAIPILAPTEYQQFKYRIKEENLKKQSYLYFHEGSIVW